MTDELTRRGRVTRIEATPNTVQIGDWFWANLRHYDEDAGDYKVSPRLACITNVGSNYVELTTINGGDFRVHFDTFDAELTPEPNPRQFIEGKIRHHSDNVQTLLGEIKQLTASLSIPVPGALPEFVEHGETAALARVQGTPIEDYKAALILAKTDQLPKLFERVKKENERVALWMKAGLIPLVAQAEQLKPIIDTIKGRIFNVELYAGLKEQAVCIREGEPASMTDPVHVFQRRHYMDEECLANYRTGGMEFEDIDQFDAWLVADDNRGRILPFPRTVVAFKVRRHHKEREGVSFSDFIAIHFKQKQDELTFLYIRNGDQVWRINTSLEFDAQLFPDERADDPNLTGTVYGYVEHGNVKRVITEGHYLAKRKERKEALAEWRREHDEYKRAVKALKDAGKKRGDADVDWPYEPHQPSDSFDRIDDYHAFTHDSVYYDDIKAFIDAEIEKKNRMVLVLQGLIDRSPVLHPHPASWQLWKVEGFNEAIRLIYDDTRGLTPGAAPDFDIYRARLNMTLRAGSITVGQDDYWAEVEADRENRRRANDWRNRRDYDRDVKRFRPRGDKGPGELAAVVSMKRDGARFTWRRRPRNEGWSGRDRPWVDAALTVPLNRLLNVSAYTPGDYRLFFNDPRTRADYLEWAPYLLLAEEYYAGNRTPGRKLRLTGKPSGWSRTTINGVTVEKTSDDEEAEEWAAREKAGD